MKKICFLTGTRADFGKIRSLMRAVNESPNFELDVFVTGMHLSKLHGSTYHEVLQESFESVHIDQLDDEVLHGSMSLRLGQIISNFTKHIQKKHPDMIVVHGDRIEAMAGALVSALNNIRLGHIEGGEITGTIDESLRHAISKLANEHFVSNEEAAECLIKLGENIERIHVIGSPDLDAMEEAKKGNLCEVKNHYRIPFDSYGIAIFHPVTTEIDTVKKQAETLVSALLESNRNWIVIYPNNDLGSKIILEEYKRFNNNHRFRVIPSIRFEAFLLLLHNADVLIGNSSAGVRESCVYGTPSIDIGTRQEGRYNKAASSTIVHTMPNKTEILNALRNIQFQNSNKTPVHWGDGDSAQKFINILHNPLFWESPLQKKLPFSS